MSIAILRNELNVLKNKTLELTNKTEIEINSKLTELQKLHEDLLDLVGITGLNSTFTDTKYNTEVKWELCVYQQKLVLRFTIDPSGINSEEEPEFEVWGPGSDDVVITYRESEKYGPRQWWLIVRRYSELLDQWWKINIEQRELSIFVDHILTDGKPFA